MDKIGQLMALFSSDITIYILVIERALQGTKVQWLGLGNIYTPGSIVVWTLSKTFSVRKQDKNLIQHWQASLEAEARKSQ